MERIIAGAFAGLLLFASPSWAQTLGAQFNLAAESNAGTDLVAAVDTAGFTADVQDLIVAQYNADNPGFEVSSIDEISDAALAATVGALLESDSSLSADQVTAVVRAAVRARPAAAAARPDLAAAIQTAAASVNPNLADQIAQAVLDALPPDVSENPAQDDASPS